MDPLFHKINKSFWWLVLALGLAAAPAASSADDAVHAPAKTGVHGSGWAFGQSADRNSPIWIKGIAPGDIKNRAKPKLEKKRAADTSNGIDAALERAEKKSAGKLGLKMENETSAWKVAPSQKDMRQDEAMAREGKHILRAYAGVEAARDLNISVGPELILKDIQNVDEYANSSQPDAALGLGMNFKFDF